MFDKKTRAKILARMKTLDSDKNFKKKIEKEVEGKKGEELKHYCSNAVKISQNEIRRKQSTRN